jgi:hypothetical protein
VLAKPLTNGTICRFAHTPDGPQPAHLPTPVKFVHLPAPVGSADAVRCVLVLRFCHKCRLRVWTICALKAAKCDHLPVFESPTVRGVSQAIPITSSRSDLKLGGASCAQHIKIRLSCGEKRKYQAGFRPLVLERDNDVTRVMGSDWAIDWGGARLTERSENGRPAPEYLSHSSQRAIWDE